MGLFTIISYLTFLFHRTTGKPWPVQDDAESIVLEVRSRDQGDADEQVEVIHLHLLPRDQHGMIIGPRSGTGVDQPRKNVRSPAPLPFINLLPIEFKGSPLDRQLELLAAGGSARHEPTPLVSAFSVWNNQSDQLVGESGLIDFVLERIADSPAVCVEALDFPVNETNDDDQAVFKSDDSAKPYQALPIVPKSKSHPYLQRAKFPSFGRKKSSMPHLRVYGYGPRHSMPPVQLSAEEFDLLETLTVTNINITMPKFNSYPDLPKQIPRRKSSAESLQTDCFVPRLMLTGFDDSVHIGENAVRANQLKVDDSLVDHRAAGLLTEKISWTRVLPPARCGYFAHFVMMMAMAMTFLTYVRVYEDFLEFEFDLDRYPIAVVACYSFLQMSLVGTTDYIATKITNLETHQSESGYGRLLRAKRGIFNLVGMFSPIIYVIGKVMMARLTMPAVHVSRVAYNSTLLIALAYPWWLTELDFDACPAEVDTTINECARLSLHVFIVTMVRVSRISDADVINDLLNRCRSVFNVQLNNEE